MRYDITVLTWIGQGKKEHVRDAITFYDVGDSVREAIAGSCRTTLSKLIRFPEDKSPEAWYLRYRTVVREAGVPATAPVISDTKWITFPGMDQRGISEFKLWAIEQLRETNEAIDTDMTIGPVATKKRSVVITAIKMLWLWFKSNKTSEQLNVR